MSTRGLWGLRRYGIDKLTYNHSDSYPDGLGSEVARAVALLGDETLERAFDGIVMVDPHGLPSRRDLLTCVESGFADGSVGDTREPFDWYSALRRLQGDPLNVLEDAAAGEPMWMTDDSAFIKDSLFCEYAYIINLDDHVLEFWCGFQRQPDYDARYGAEAVHAWDGTQYYPCRMMASFPLERFSKGLSYAVEVVQKMDDIASSLQD